jgi:hypothetical protein
MNENEEVVIQFDVVTRRPGGKHYLQKLGALPWQVCYDINASGPGYISEQTVTLCMVNTEEEGLAKCAELDLAEGGT